MAFVCCLEIAMSKVFSFRLSHENPREAQAREVIEAWVSKGYSIRYVIVDALLSYEKADTNCSELNSVIEQLHDLITAVDKQPNLKLSEAVLSNSFLDEVKQSARNGVKAKYRHTLY